MCISNHLKYVQDFVSYTSINWKEKWLRGQEDLIVENTN